MLENQTQTMDDSLNVDVLSLDSRIGEAKYQFRMLQNAIDFATEIAINDPSQKTTMIRIITNAIKNQRIEEQFLESHGISFNVVSFND